MTYGKAGLVPTIEAIGRVPDKDADNSAGSQDPASQQKGEITRKQNQENERGMMNYREMYFVRLPCGMRIGSPVVKRASWLQGRWNRIKRQFKKAFEM